MKFVVSSTELLSHLQAISRVINSKNRVPDFENNLFNSDSYSLSRFEKYEFSFSEKYSDYNFLLKLLVPYNKELRTSKYEKENDRPYTQHQVKFEKAEIFSYKEEKDNLTQLLDFKSFYSGSIKQIQHQLAIYTGLLQSTLFRVLRNTRIHSLSIFFGLCCSSSGYIFNAITGTSSHPVLAQN
jgi:hypothetical protein